jgi:hypothetical protein
MRKGKRNRRGIKSTERGRWGERERERAKERRN